MWTLLFALALRGAYPLNFERGMVKP